MPRQFSRSAASTFLLVAHACAFPFYSEATSWERITLLTSGRDCSSHHRVMVEALQDMDGIVQIEAGLIPEHLMIDQAAGHRTAEELTTILTRALPAGHGCHVAVMRSCISAGSAQTP